MRTEEQIKRELLEAKEKVESYRSEVKDYNGDSGADRYMFFTSISQLISGASEKVSNLQEELEKASKNSHNNN